MVKATAGRTIRISLIGDTSGATNADFIATGQWQFVTVSKTFAAGDTTSRTRTCSLTDGNVGDTFLHDAIMTNANGAPLPFVEKEALATNVTVPTPFAAGGAFSAIILFWTPTAGNDGVARTIFDTVGTGAAQNRVLLQKDAANNLNFNVWDNASAVKQCVEAVTAADWPAGALKMAAVSRDAAGLMNAALGGVTFGSLNAGAGTGLEAAVGAVSQLGATTTPGDPLNGTMLAAFYKRAMGPRELVTLSHRIMDSLGI
jgi:hypothetical protein